MKARNYKKLLLSKIFSAVSMFKWQKSSFQYLWLWCLCQRWTYYPVGWVWCN